MLTVDVCHFYTSSKNNRAKRKNQWTERAANERINFTTGMLCVILDNLHAENKNSNQLVDLIWWRIDYFELAYQACIVENKIKCTIDKPRLSEVRWAETLMGLWLWGLYESADIQKEMAITKLKFSAKSIHKM